MNFLYRIQEGTEFLNNPEIDNLGTSRFYYEFVSEYNRKFNKLHEIGGLLVFNFSESLNTIGGDSAFSTLPSRNMGLSGRFSYNYDTRYFTELNFGYNGSEKFAKNNRFGFFPSIGLGWILSNEEWFNNKLPDINMFKLTTTANIYTYKFPKTDYHR